MRGHSVDVVTAVPNYPLRIIDSKYRGGWVVRSEERGVTVHRHWLRVRPAESFVDKALYEASFVLSSLPTFMRLRRRRRRCLPRSSGYLPNISTTLPGGRRTVLWVQDVVSAAAASLSRRPGVALRAIARPERRAAQRADHVIVCSDGFVPLIEAPPERTTTVLNWVDTDEISARPKSPNGHATRFLYAGNLGYTQGLDTAIEAARDVDDIELQLVGAGNAATDVRATSDGIAIVSPPVPRHQLPALLASADVQLVLQRRVAAGANLPSKIATYLASGRPVLAAIDPSTPAAALLRESGGAVLVPPEDPRSLAAAMAALRDDPARRAELGERGRAFAERRLSSEVLLPQLEAAILGS